MLINIYYLSAILASLIWAIGASINTHTVRYRGVITTNQLRILMATVVLWGLVFVYGDWRIFADSHLFWLSVLSGFIGITLGDTALYKGIKELGGRRMGAIFSLASPFTVIIAFLYLGEMLSLYEYLGCLTVTIGIIIVILGRDKQTDTPSTMENVTAHWKTGVFWAIIAALGQAIAVIMIRVGMSETDVDIWSFSAVRMTAALVFMVLFGLVLRRYANPVPLNPITVKYLCGVAFSSICGLVGGMTLVIFALSGADAGIIATLSSMSPAFTLPIVWWQTRKYPSVYAYTGAFLVILGTGLINL